MRITINHRNLEQRDHHTTRSIVRAAFALHDVAGPGIEVHIKRCAKVHSNGLPQFAGNAYEFPPYNANIHPRTRYLVTLRLSDPDADGYPFTWGYHRAKTAVSPTLHSWEEALAYLAGHEARHVRQFDAGLPTSEIDAEAGGLMALNNYRRQR